MAIGQIDPARLEGDALRRWYLRSPADIEGEREQAAALRYRDFFGAVRSPVRAMSLRPSDSPTPIEVGNKSEATSLQLSEGRDGGLAHYAAAPDTRWGVVSHQLVSGPSRGKPPPSGSDCTTCHGRLPLPPIPPLPWPIGTFPFPPGSVPSFRDIPGSIPGGSGGSGDSTQSRREWSDRSQCNQQFEADREICQKAKSPQCWANQNKRLAHCSITGEVGTPPLKFGPPGR
jgi:hypothetical protein